MQVARLQEVRFTIAAGDSQQTASLTGFTNLDQMVCFATWRVEDGLNPIGQSVTELDVWPNLTSQITAQRNGTPSVALDVTAYVLQFAADTTVYKGVWSMTDVETSDAAVAIGSTVTLANTFGWHYGRSADGGTPAIDSDPDGRHRLFEFNGPTTATTFDISRGAAKGSQVGHWFVVESSTLSVLHETESWVGIGSGLFYHNLGSAVNFADTFVLCTHTTNEVSDNDMTICSDLFDNAGQDTIRHRRAFSNPVDLTFGYQIVTDSAFTVQRGDFISATSPDSASITAVDRTAAIVKQPTGRSGEESGDYFAGGTIDGRYTEMWLSADGQVDGRQGAGGASRTIPWEVVQFEKFSAGGRRVLVSG